MLECLAYFKPSLDVPTKVTCDASPLGLGAILWQQDKSGTWLPVTCASRSLSVVESRYSQLEREMLGIVFSLTRFRQYVLGRSVQVVTDHKPLISIVQKPFDKVPPQLQRWMVALQLEREMLGIVFSLTRFRQYVLGRSVQVVTDLKPLISIVQKPFDKVPPQLQRWMVALQLEREMLGIVFSLTRFRQYVLGRSVQVVTDHKPLISIVQKPFDKVPPQLQRWMVALMPYKYTLSHAPGKQMVCLTRRSPLYG